VDAHLDRVINICYRYVLNRAEAEDLAQDTFVTVYQSLSTFREDANITTWIHQIAVRKSLDHLRSKNRQKRKGFFSRVLNLNDPEVEVAAPAVKNPSHILEEKERRQHLQNALATLPKNQQTAFILSKYNEMDYKEISEIMELSVSSVTSLVHRAKKNLKERLTDYYLNNFGDSNILRKDNKEKSSN